MPLNKNAYLRYRMIDKLLRQKDFVKTSFIKSKLEDRHDIFVGETSINKDIRDMMTELHAPIEYSHSQKAYFYPPNVEELFPALELLEEEISALTFYAKTFEQYKEFNVFKDFSSAIDKVVNAVNISTSQNQVEEDILIQPENHPIFKGSELIPSIISGFNTECKFQFDYKKHTSEEVKSYRVSPIMLKEYDGLWYLLTQIDFEIKTFALDRISNIEVVDEKREEIKDFDPEKYFDHAFGISVTSGKVEEVLLEFDSWRGKYLLSSPIHKSQKFIEEKNGKMIFRFQVIPFHELYGKILSYGNQVTVLKPKSLVNKIKVILIKTLEKY